MGDNGTPQAAGPGVPTRPIKQVSVVLGANGVMQIAGSDNMLPLELSGLLLKAATLVSNSPGPQKAKGPIIAKPGLHLPPGFNPKGQG